MLITIYKLKGEYILRKIILIILFCLLLVGCSKYPQNYPELIIENNGMDFETEVNEVSWFDNTGSSLISVPEWDIAEDMKSIEVKANDKLTLKLGYTNEISEMRACEVKKSLANRQETPINIVDSYVQAPTEKGEYLYSIKVTCLWCNNALPIKT